MVLSELIQRLNNSAGAKVGIVVVVSALVIGVGYEIYVSSQSINNGYGPQVAAQTLASNAQKQLDQLKSNTTLPAGLKAAEMAHLQAQIDLANGKGKATQTGPPSGMR